MIYGKKELSNSYKKTFLDWLPHPLSVIINFCGKPKEFKILDYSKDVKKELVIEKLKILFNLNTFSIILNFSNNLKIPSKKIFIFKDKKNLFMMVIKTNQRSVKLLLDDFYKLKKKRYKRK